MSLDSTFDKIAHVSRRSGLDVQGCWSAIRVRLNGQFRSNAISLFFFFVETIRTFKYCIHKLHLGFNDDSFLSEVPSYPLSYFFLFVFSAFCS